jgi:hypothetical protein
MLASRAAADGNRRPASSLLQQEVGTVFLARSRRGPAARRRRGSAWWPADMTCAEPLALHEGATERLVDACGEKGGRHQAAVERGYGVAAIRRALERYVVASTAE